MLNTVPIIISVILICIKTQNDVSEASSNTDGCIQGSSPNCEKCADGFFLN